MSTFIGLLQLATLCNLDRLTGLVSLSLGNILNFFDYIVAFEDLSKNDMLAVKPAVPFN